MTDPAVSSERVRKTRRLATNWFYIPTNSTMNTGSNVFPINDIDPTVTDTGGNKEKTERGGRNETCAFDKSLVHT